LLLLYFIQDDLTPFLEVLSLCHTVQIEEKAPTVTTAAARPLSSCDTVDGPGGDSGNGGVKKNGQHYEYHASSPDEKALVEACRK
jgi:hypothetical protein